MAGSEGEDVPTTAESGGKTPCKIEVLEDGSTLVEGHRISSRYEVFEASLQNLASLDDFVIFTVYIDGSVSYSKEYTYLGPLQVEKGRPMVKAKGSSTSFEFYKLSRFAGEGKKIFILRKK